MAAGEADLEWICFGAKQEMLDPSSLNGNLLLSMIKPRLIEFTALAYISLETEQQQKGLSDVNWFHGCLDKMFSVRSYWPGLSETSRWFLTFERGPGYSQHCSQTGQCPLGPGKEHIIKAQQMGGWKIEISKTVWLVTVLEGSLCNVHVGWEMFCEIFSTGILHKRLEQWTCPCLSIMD